MRVDQVRNAQDFESTPNALPDVAARCAVAYPAAELIALYHERWEIELGFDEVKTRTCLRDRASRPFADLTPKWRGSNELWGIALAYKVLVRLGTDGASGMTRPTCYQRTRSASSIVAFAADPLYPNGHGAPARSRTPGCNAGLKQLRMRLSSSRRHAVLSCPRHMRPRTYPRAVKIKMSNYHVGSDRQQPNGPAC